MSIEGWAGAVHPAAELFPLIEGDEFDQLVADIDANGLLEPVWVMPDGALLDGRNRVKACFKTSTPIQTRTYEGSDPIGFVLSLNLKRRHLTTGQRAMLALQVESLIAEHNRPGRRWGVEDDLIVADLPQLSDRERKSREQAAKSVGTSGRAVAQAKRIQQEAPDLAEKVIAGELALDKAEREVKSRQARERNEQRRNDAEERAKSGGTLFEIRRGDFQIVLDAIADESVDLIVTDPPYGDEHTHLYGDLGEWAARKLKPGGSLVAYVGQGNLPDVCSALDAHLRYWWTLALVHKHGAQQLPGKWIMVEWKPLVWYVKGHRSGRQYVADRMSGSRPHKELHEWAQGTDEVAYLIEQLSEPGGLVVDPFAGSGSFGYAAQALGRDFIGAENGSHKDAR